MLKTKKRLSEYWDNLILNKIPPYAKFHKAEAEIKEHFSFLTLAFNRLIIPLVLIYIIVGFILKLDIFGSLFVSLIIFIYSNFLPDADFLFAYTADKKKESLWYERYFFLCFMPIVAYYILVGKARPLYSSSGRSFHNIRTIIIYGIFLLIIGSIFWSSTFKTIMLAVFGVLGFAFHLMVDKIIRIEKKLFFKKKKS